MVACSSLLFATEQADHQIGATLHAVCRTWSVYPDDLNCAAVFERYPKIPKGNPPDLGISPTYQTVNQAQNRSFAVTVRTGDYRHPVGHLHRDFMIEETEEP